MKKIFKDDDVQKTPSIINVISNDNYNALEKNLNEVDDSKSFINNFESQSILI